MGLGTNHIDYTLVNANGNVPTIYTMEYLEERDKHLHLADKVWQLDKKYLESGRTYKVDQVVDLNAYDKAMGSQVTFQQPSETPYTVTVDKHKEVSLLVETEADAQSRFDKISQYARKAGYALAKQMDTDLAGLYTGWSTTDQGTAGTALTKPTLLAAQQELTNNDVPTSDRCFVLHSVNYEDLMGLASLTYASNIGNMNSASPIVEGMANGSEGYFGKFFGDPVYLSTNIKVTAGTPTYHNLYFHKEAMALAKQIEPTVIQAKHAEYLNAQQYSVYDLYGVAALRADHGVEVNS